MNAPPVAKRSPVDAMFKARQKKGDTEYSDREHPDVQRFKKSVLEALGKAQEGAVLRFSLGGALLSSSCFAETIGTALKRIATERRGKLPGRFVVADDPTGENWWDADAALRKMSSDENLKLVCVWRGPGDAVRLLGPVDEQAQATYDFVAGCGEEGATTRELAEVQDISIQAASNRMSRTAEIGLIRRVKRESVSGGGTQHVYVAVR